jgi:DNA-binding winged helix-turn-helix (wHTH) protein/Flp pilus assembly protein TadD
MNKAMHSLAFDELTAASVLRTGTSALRVGACWVEPDLDRISGPVGEIALEPKAMAVLVYLAARPGQVVSVDALVDAIWQGRPMGDNPVYKCIAQLRRALGDDPKAPTYIVTVPKKGYRLIAPVAPLERGSNLHVAIDLQVPDEAFPSRNRRLRSAAIAALAILGLSAVMATAFRPSPPVARQASTGIEQTFDDARAATPEAYAAYVKGHFYWSRNSPESLLKAHDQFAQAVAADPGFVSAWVDLGLVSLAMSSSGQQSRREALLQAGAAAQKATALAPDSAPAQVLLATVKEREWDWSVAERAFRRAIKINPDDISAHYLYGRLLARSGRLDEARDELRRARELAPISLVISTASADPDFYAGHYDRASAQYQAVLELDPTFSRARLFLGYTCEQEGHPEQAIAHFRQAMDSNDRMPALAAIGHAQALAGQRAAAQDTLAALVRSEAHVDPYLPALIHVGLGEHDAAFRWLEAAYAEHSEEFLQVRIDPRLAPLRADPRYRNLIARMELEH